MTESLARSLKQHPLTAGMTPEMVEFLAGCVKNQRFAAGDLLFAEGQAKDWLYLIRQGEVDLQSHVPGRGAVAVERLGAGATLGASAIVAPHEWHVDARAATAVLAFAIPGDCLRGKLRQDAVFAAKLLERLLVEVHTRLSHARLQQLDVYKGELT